MKGTKQRLVQRRMARRPDTRQQRCCQIAGQRLKEKEGLFPFVKRLPFSLCMRHPLFLSGTSGRFCKFMFSFFKIKFKVFIYLFVPYITVNLPINRPIVQSFKQLVYQQIKSPNYQSADIPTNQPTKQINNQLVYQQIKPPNY